MPESIIQVSPDSTGKKLHTFQRIIGANTVEDEVVIFGENYLPSYIVNQQTGNSSTATANSHLMQVMAGASLRLRIRRIEIFQITMATAVSNPAIAIVRLTTAGTGGTALTPQALDTADAGSGATAMSLPTVKGAEGAIVWVGNLVLMQTLAASADLPQPRMVIDFDRPRSKPFYIPAGASSGFAVKLLNAVAGATVQTNIWLDESSF